MIWWHACLTVCHASMLISGVLREAPPVCARCEYLLYYENFARLCCESQVLWRINYYMSILIITFAEWRICTFRISCCHSPHAGSVTLHG